MPKYLRLNVESYTEVIREAKEDEWDRNDTSTSHEFIGLILSEKDHYQALPVEDDIKVGDILYAVIVVYSTGDTFGSDHGSQVEFLSVHKSKELAEKNKNSIRDKEDGANYEIVLDNGEKISRYCQWDGYFESLDYVICKALKVE